MEVILDSNEFIFGFTASKRSCSDLLKLIGIKFNAILPDIIFREVFERLKMLEGNDKKPKGLYMSFITLE